MILLEWRYIKTKILLLLLCCVLRPWPMKTTLLESFDDSCTRNSNMVKLQDDATYMHNGIPNIDVV